MDTWAREADVAEVRQGQERCFGPERGGGTGVRAPRSQKIRCRHASVSSLDEAGHLEDLQGPKAAVHGSGG